MLIDAPPTTKATFRGVFCTSWVNISLICLANSRVGAKTSPRTDFGAGMESIASIWVTRGRPKAAVLPLPVCAKPITSPPSSAIGMAWLWIGVGSVIPSSFRRSTSFSGRPIISNCVKRLPLRPHASRKANYIYPPCLGQSSMVQRSLTDRWATLPSC